ncbi:DUF3750 domain-containing protein [Denitrobaculum tricleocarpae]|uniref:DUF3750 domain-containing protein n=1 Tax=Denitrobaculum tricleocarpae TaxID=2591009 RepID=A0A545T0U5_9PROT|nr:DUF3750 domain-containing protein [Denitrobaculum tricleocarpae]TQV70843.1 DUF3750 domain-containing protein [Denitrobaculum tricleocarpae]
MKRSVFKSVARILRNLGLAVILLLAGPLMAAVTGQVNVSRSWSEASRASTGLAPDPAFVREPVVQVYGARAFGWRGAFAVHTWVSVKRENATEFSTYEVIGWRFWGGRSPLVRRDGAPDRRWFGSTPEVYVDLRGPKVEAVIDKIELAIQSYPHANDYKTWPGPNSNTFTATIGRAVPELRLELPPTAVGKDYLGATTLAARTPSGTGVQLSALGLLGVMAGLEEGLEVSVLGLAFGVDPLDLAIKLPGIGRIGGIDKPQRRLQ